MLPQNRWKLKRVPFTTQQLEKHWRAQLLEWNRHDSAVHLSDFM
jgi:hypothetical protein